MLVPLDITAIEEYSLTADKSDNPTKFKLGYFDLMLRAHLSKELAAMRRIGSRDEAIFTVIKVVRLGLKGWDWKDDKDALFPFDLVEEDIPGVAKYKAVDYRSMNYLQSAWVNELADRLMQMNYPSSGPRFNEEAFREAHPDLYKKFLMGNPEKN